MEFIIGLVVIIFSVLSELAKKKDDSSPDGNDSYASDDLKKIEDFFKGKIGQTGQTEGSAFPPPFESSSTSNPEDSSDYYIRNSKKKNSHKDQNKSARKNRREASHDHGQHSLESTGSLEGASLDAGASLTGSINHEEHAVLSVQRNRHDPDSPVRKVHRNLAFTKESLLNAVILQELINRYDFQRIYSRIPCKRTDRV
ncbi:MAG: hypothetical protein HQM10_20730 [Candidatus Riflebacteria bacterium]|nr:hypothetical protein [Candidatus Riflebacteria bacterium]